MTLVQVGLALLLFAGGGAFWTLAKLERDMASAHDALMTLAPRAAGAYDAIEAGMNNVRRLPRVGDSLLADIRADRSIAGYWEANYSALVSSLGDTPAARDADQLFIAANAAYRASRQQRATARVAVQQLDSAARRYAAVLEQRPTHVDAAYNYEFVVRLRNRIARSNGTLPVAKLAERKADLPTGRTLHGEPGAPPVATNLGQFDLIIPLQPDEDDMHADGKKPPKQRKG